MQIDLNIFLSGFLYPILLFLLKKLYDILNHLSNIRERIAKLEIFLETQFGFQPDDEGDEN